ncbi:MAG: GDP-mannose 4,6-dehydratase [Microvirga sp.]
MPKRLDMQPAKQSVLGQLKGRVLVTGGAGFIGSHLVDVLVSTGAAVTVLDDFSIGSIDNLSGAMQCGDVRILEGSILDYGAVDEALAGCDRVFHLAVQCVRRSLGAPMESHEVNATGTLNILEAARRQRVDRFIYCSSSEVYGNASERVLNEDATPCRPVTVYGGAKLAGELYTEAYRQTYSLPTLVVRPFNAYGPRAHQQGQRAEVIPRFVIRVLNGLPPIVFGDGSNGRDFTYVTEVARGLALAGASDRLVGQRVNIAYGRMITVAEVANAVARACGRSDLQAEYSNPRPGDVHKLRADTKKAKTLLGYAAEISFEEGIRRYVEWFRSAFPDPSVLTEAKAQNWTMPPTETVHLGEGAVA